MKVKLNIITALILGLILTVSLFGQVKYQVRITDKLAENKGVSKQIGTLREKLERDFQELNLQIIFDSSFQDVPLENKFENLKTTTRIDLLLKQNQLDIAILEDKKTIIFQDSPANRVRVEKMELEKYKLTYLSAENLQTILPDLLPKEHRFFHLLKDRNTLLVTGSKLDHLKIKALLNALDFAPLTINLEVNFYEITTDKQKDLLAGLGQGFSPTNPLNLLSISQLALNDTKNVRYLGQVNLILLNGKTSSLSIGEKVPIKTASFYGYNPIDTSANPVNMVGKILQTLLPQNSDQNATFNFENAALEIVATPNLSVDSTGEPSLNMALEIKNCYPDVIRTNSPIFQNMVLKTMQIMEIGKPMVVASWTIEKTSKENRPMFIPFIPLPSKSVKSNRQSMMTLTAKIKNDTEIVKSLNKEATLEEKLRSIFSVEIISQMKSQTRPRIIVP